MKQLSLSCPCTEKWGILKRVYSLTNSIGIYQSAVMLVYWYNLLLLASVWLVPLGCLEVEAEVVGILLVYSIINCIAETVTMGDESILSRSVD